MQNIKRWEVRQRLEFIEARLYWDGKLNRSDLVDFFGISTLQASKDISKYQELAPGNMDYDTKLRQYSVSQNFEPKFIQPDAESYLAKLQVLSFSKDPSSANTLLGVIPAFNIIPTPARKIDVNILKRVLKAIREAEEVHVYYQSMTRPEPIWRWVAPHAFSFDGLRWHIRAYCHETQSFRDFLLSRIIKIEDFRGRSIDHRDDVEWFTSKSLRIAPHPGLSPSQKKVIEYDYGMSDGYLEISIKVASLIYFLKRFGLDKEAPKRKPEEQQIILLNPEDVL